MSATKYYLHGGNPSEPSIGNEQFMNNLTQDINENSKVLFCYFAKDRDEWDESFSKHSKRFSELNKTLKFQIAQENNFQELCEESQLIYLAGGDAFKLIEKLSHIKDLPKLFNGKIIVGISAGACALSKCFYSNDEQRVAEGLGILNLKVHCHYTKDKVHNIEKLADYKDQLEIIALPEQSSVQIYGRNIRTS